MPKKGNCYTQQVDERELLIAEDTEFDLTRNRVYVAIKAVGPNLITVKNDKDEVEIYTTECFRFYEGERIC